MSSEPYTPTVEEVRTDYVLAYADRDSSQLLAGVAFDRFIAKIKADALREAAEAWRKHLLTTDASYVCAESWLTVRADRIEGEA